jgi:hypothetical protein
MNFAVSSFRQLELLVRRARSFYTLLIKISYLGLIYGPDIDLHFSTIRSPTITNR